MKVKFDGVKVVSSFGDELVITSVQIQHGWVMGGDFNDISHLSEKKGGLLRSNRKCEVFGDRINACKPMDLNFVGHYFIWRWPIFHGGG